MPRKITKKELNEWALDEFGKKYDELDRRSQYLIIEKAETWHKEIEPIKVKRKDYYDDIALTKYEKYFDYCNASEKGWVKMAADSNARSNNLIIVD